MIGWRAPATQRLTRLLEAQHKALLAGDIAVLGQMAEDLQVAFIALGKEGGARSDLDRIKEAAARNARLLAAAQTGVATARAHLTKARAPGLTTYDAQGKPHASAALGSRDLARR